MNNLSRPIDWIEGARAHLLGEFPNVRDHVQEIALSLSRLLMERLPLSLSGQLMLLLPEEARRGITGIRVRAGGHGNPEVGYANFVRKTFEILNRSDFPTRSHELQALATRMTDSWLWAIAHEIPPELKSRIADHLPIELRSRMNLFSGHGEEKVA